MKKSTVFIAEMLGTCFLAMAVIGSGIMAEKLAQGNILLSLLCNAFATAAMLYVLITGFAPFSGANFNPIISILNAFLKKASWQEMRFLVFAQLCGAFLGVMCTHLMFNMPLMQISTTVREGFSLYFAEFIATFGLVLIILIGSEKAPQSVPTLVASFIFAAYFFTASTSFANPILTLARSLTNSFAGIAPQTLLYFIFAQMLGGLCAYLLVKSIFMAKK
jgi:glycerol uptake facilitator-like aquaporin